MNPQSVSSEILLGAWAASLLSLFIYSFLYKDNPLFKLAEHIFVGVSVGYVLTITYHEVMLKKLYVPLVEQADWLLLIAAGLGLFMLARLVPAWAWLSRIAFAFILGISSGVAIPRFLSSFVLQQVQGTLTPLVSVGPDGWVFGLAELNAGLILVGVVSVLFYFFFSVEHGPGTRYVARTGMYFLMVSFGAAFGYTVMARMSLHPFRAGFDRDTGDLYIGDVGEDMIEEIDLIPTGADSLNFGWPFREGTQAFSAPNSPSLTPPVTEYAHGSGPREGRSITGGYVYRGPIAVLTGRYFFADFISDNIWSLPVSAFNQGDTVSSDAFTLENGPLTPDAGTLGNIVSFGEDNLGNLFIVSLGGDIFRIEPAP